MSRNPVVTMIAGAIALSAAVAHATDIANQDGRDYAVRVQGEGKLSTSTYTVRARGSTYGLCNYEWCTFAVPGYKVMARKNERLTIRGGRFIGADGKPVEPLP